MEGGIFLAAHLFIHSFLYRKKSSEQRHIHAETVRSGSSPPADPTVLAAAPTESPLFLAFLEGTPLRLDASYPVSPEIKFLHKQKQAALFMRLLFCPSHHFHKAAHFFRVLLPIGFRAA